jgi:very-short-patch-repair endonuclease
LRKCAVIDPHTIEPPPGFKGLSNDAAIEIHRAFIEKWFELMLKEINKDLAKVKDVELFDQLVLRAKWMKQVDLLLAGHDSMKKYNTPEGELELLAQAFGDQLGLPAQSFPADIDGRLGWYKKRIAGEYERRVKNDVNTYGISSPIEQIFLMEWHFLKVDEQYGVKIRPQRELKLDGQSYTIDFMVESPNGKVRLAVELDGHDFHERTKEQAAHDRARERAIVRHGYAIFRFTGSEVFRNPRRCVEEVVAMIAGTSR